MKTTTSALILALLGMTLSSPAAILYRYTFDNSTSGPFASRYLIAGLNETETNVTGSGAALGLVPYTSNVVNPPVFTPTTSVTADNTTAAQGGNCLQLDATTSPDGAIVDFNPSYGANSYTFEAIFNVSQFSPTSNTAGLSYVLSTEWPSAGPIQHNMRFIGNTLQFLANIPGTGPTHGEVSSAFTGPLSPNHWYHAAGVMTYNVATPSSSTVALYLDGVSTGAPVTIDLTGSFPWFFGCSYSPSYGQCLAVGVNPGGGTVFAADPRGLRGAIDAIAVSDTALAPGSFALKTLLSRADDWALFQ